MLRIRLFVLSLCLLFAGVRAEQPSLLSGPLSPANPFSPANPNGVYHLDSGRSHDRVPPALAPDRTDPQSLNLQSMLSFLLVTCVLIGFFFIVASRNQSDL